MRVLLLEFAIKKYERAFDRRKLKHAGFLSYADERGKVVARSSKAGGDGEITPLSSKEMAAAAKRRRIRDKGKKKLSGRVIDGRANRVR